MKTLCGYALFWSTPSPNPLRIGNTSTRFREFFIRGAFTNLLTRREDTCAWLNHTARLQIGRRSDGSLRLFEDRKGLYVEADLDPAYEKLAKYVVGWSICYVPIGDLDIWNPGCEPARRYVAGVSSLPEVSILLRGKTPALKTSIWCEDRGDAEAALRRQTAVDEFECRDGLDVMRRRIELLKM